MALKRQEIHCVFKATCCENNAKNPQLIIYLWPYFFLSHLYSCEGIQLSIVTSNIFPWISTCSSKESVVGGPRAPAHLWCVETPLGVFTDFFSSASGETRVEGTEWRELDQLLASRERVNRTRCELKLCFLSFPSNVALLPIKRISLRFLFPSAVSVAVEHELTVNLVSCANCCHPRTRITNTWTWMRR